MDTNLNTIVKGTVMQISHFFFFRFETAPWATQWHQSFLTSLNVADWENKHHCHVWKVKAEKCLICRAIHFDFHLAAVTEDTWTTAVGIIRRPKQTCFVGWLDSCSVKEIHAHKIKKVWRPDFLFNPFLAHCARFMLLWKSHKMGQPAMENGARTHSHPALSRSSSPRGSRSGLGWVSTAEAQDHEQGPVFPVTQTALEEVYIILLNSQFLQEPGSFCQAASLYFKSTNMQLVRRFTTCMSIQFCTC